MPIYEDETTTREKLYELRRRNRCQVCRGALDVFMDVDKGKAFLACQDWRRTHHQGIERVAQPPFEPNIPTRREDVVEELGEKKAVVLEKYEGVVSLTRAQAMEILKTIWPEAPEVEVLKAAIICHQYGLNPLMKHIFLIPFKRKKEGKVIGVDWVVVQGIGSNRLIARRKHNYSYLDLTPRRMTEEEQQRINGEVDDTRIWAITKLKDMETNAEALGVGSWPIDEVPYGTEKGNTKLNMACIRSEREALDRLYPAEMPQGIEVMEEKYIDAKYTLLAEGGGGKAAASAEGGKEKTLAAVTPPTEDKSSKIADAPPAAAEGEGFHIDLTWLSESLKEIKWTEDTCKTFLIGKYKIDGTGTLTEVLQRLTRKQAEEFTKELAEKVTQKVQRLI